MRDKLFKLKNAKYSEDLINSLSSYLISEEETKANRYVLISNPCFEVWLWYHYITESNETDVTSISDWKGHLHSNINGGYKLEEAIQNLELAINNAKNRYKSNGHFPEVVCSSVYLALEKILNLGV
jgi:hypothetical protein